MAGKETEIKYPGFIQELMDRFYLLERKQTEAKFEMDAELKRTKDRLVTTYTKQRELDGIKLIVHFLDILDNLERALAATNPQLETVYSLQAGIQLIVDQFKVKLHALNVVSVPLKDKPYDPEFAQAIFAQEVDQADLHGVVLQEHLTCYAMDTTIIRSGQVVVGKKREVPGAKVG